MQTGNIIPESYREKLQAFAWKYFDGSNPDELGIQSDRVQQVVKELPDGPAGAAVRLMLKRDPDLQTILDILRYHPRLSLSISGKDIARAGIKGTEFVVNFLLSEIFIDEYIELIVKNIENDFYSYISILKEIDNAGDDEKRKGCLDDLKEKIENKCGKISLQHIGKKLLIPILAYIFSVEGAGIVRKGLQSDILMENENTLVVPLPLDRYLSNIGTLGRLYFLYKGEGFFGIVRGFLLRVAALMTSGAVGEIEKRCLPENVVILKPLLNSLSFLAIKMKELERYCRQMWVDYSAENWSEFYDILVAYRLAKGLGDEVGLMEQKRALRRLVEKSMKSVSFARKIIF